MNYTERKIIDTYSMLFRGLSHGIRVELIDNLVKSLAKKDEHDIANVKDTTYEYGAGKTAEEIINEIRASRTFRKKDIKF